MLKSDKWIKKQSRPVHLAEDGLQLLNEYGTEVMINPFIPNQVRGIKRKDVWQLSQLIPFSQGRFDFNEPGDDDELKLISYGVSSYGYDCRLSVQELQIFSPLYHEGVLDPLKFNAKSLINVELATNDDEIPYFMLPAHHYGLGITLETFHIPKKVTALAIAKSTYARLGLMLNITPMETMWNGRLVVEFYNAANLPIRIYPNQGFFQALFFESDEECDVSYADRQGKYQGQENIVHAKV